MKNSKDALLKSIGGVLVVALIVSAYLTLKIYMQIPSELCNLNAQFDCTAVTNSPYAKIDGIFYFITRDMGIPFPTFTIDHPVALLGVIVFVTMLFLLQRIRKTTGKQQARAVKITKIITYASVCFALYLLFVSAFILHKFCVLCITLDVLIITLFFLVLKLPEPKAL